MPSSTGSSDSLTASDRSSIQSEAEQRNKFIAEKNELKFKLHELEQKRLLIWIQMANLIVITVLVVFLILYYRPKGISAMFANWKLILPSLKSAKLSSEPSESGSGSGDGVSPSILSDPITSSSPSKTTATPTYALSSTSSSSKSK